MDDDPLMQMYEAQAIAIEQKAFIDKLQREKEELEEKVRLLEERQTATRLSSISDQLGSDWTAVEDTHELIAEEEQQGEEEKTDEGLTTKEEVKETIVLIGKIGNGRQMLVLADNEWKMASVELPHKIGRGGAVYLNGEIYIFGGNYMLDKVLKLDKNMKWNQLANMKEKSSHVANSCLEWKGGIWVIGGWNGQKTMATVHRYNPNLWFFQPKWNIMPEMKEARLNATASLCGKIVVCGGWNVEKKSLSSVEVLDPDRGEWSCLPEMPTPRSGHSQVSLGDGVLVLAGCTGETYLQSVIRLRPMEETPAWEELSPMRYACDGAAAAVLDDEIYSIGGYNGREELRRVEIFDGTSWRDGPELPAPYQGLSALVVSQELADALCR